MTAFHVGPDLIHWRGLSESPDTGPALRTRPRRGSPHGARASPRCTPARAPSDPGRDPSRESRDMSAALNDIIRDELTFTPRGAGGWATGLAGSGRDAATGERDCGKRRRTRTGTGDGRGSRPPPPACASPVPATSSQQRVAGTRERAREREETREESRPLFLSEHKNRCWRENSPVVCASAGDQAYVDLAGHPRGVYAGRWRERLLLQPRHDELHQRRALPTISNAEQRRLPALEQFVARLGELVQFVRVWDRRGALQTVVALLPAAH